MEPRPPDDFGINFLPFQAAETEVFSMRPSPQNLTTDGGGYAEESRGRRRRSESELYSRSDKVPVNTARNHPYPSRSRSRTPAECPGYRARVSTEASKRVSDARRTAPAPYQCHICSSTFTRADGLQNHLDRHNGKGKTTKCDFCHEEKTTISRHMKTCSMNPNRQPAKSNKK
ncbi:hypothetical protein M413DRAFT_28291 [Hebeloma cylindrosporum]|uniref:C2H2-type domain-containing protein n=1 Tax=Hebeloma cylindrosporum TaxID=76867 RepID=A0A0C3CA34_HEBCY|nr:hypothetical protein M413DRAFT_28291 [Hebeloma cylindrosporum h7]